MSQDQEDQSRRSNSNGGVMFGTLTCFVALLLIVGPLIAGSQIGMGGIAQMVVAGFGILFLIVGGAILVISKLYIRTTADESFVRTGSGGQKAIINGGALVIPVIHEITWVSHATMKLVVERLGVNALITGDNLRADVIAEFYIRIPKDETATVNAASSLGNKGMHPVALKELVFQKLENALRSVAGTKNLMELHADRQSFVDSVQKIVSVALEANGLSLEETTISKLDQTALGELEADGNIFDAQGAKVIADVVQKARVERNKIQRDADRTVKDQDVETQKSILAREVELAETEAESQQQKATASAKARQEAESVEADQQRIAELARVKQARDVQVAEVEKQKDLEVASEQREQAQETARIGKERAVEVANVEKRIAVENEHKSFAIAEAERQEAEAIAERNRQAVTTVTVTETAEREARKAVIEETGEADKEAYRENKKADVAAYAVTKQADAELEAADKKATAVRKHAEAARDSEKARAEGQKANAMIPVEVDREQVQVEEARVAVKRQDLENQAEFQAISKELTIALENIGASKEVQIATAQAMGLALAAAKMTIWGDHDTFKSMTSSFFTGQRGGIAMEGLLAGSPERVTDLAEDTIRGAGGLVARLAEKFGGMDLEGMDVEEIAGVIAEHVSSKSKSRQAEA